MLWWARDQLGGTSAEGALVRQVDPRTQQAGGRITLASLSPRPAAMPTVSGSYGAARATSRQPDHNTVARSP